MLFGLESTVGIDALFDCASQLHNVTLFLPLHIFSPPRILHCVCWVNIKKKKTLLSILNYICSNRLKTKSTTWFL